MLPATKRTALRKASLLILVKVPKLCVAKASQENVAQSKCNRVSESQRRKGQGKKERYEAEELCFVEIKSARRSLAFLSPGFVARIFKPPS